MLQLAAESYGIDLMWFVSTHYSQVDIPYLCTVFDLEHRRHPFFPEVGAPEYWKATERRYQTMIPRAAYVISGTEAGKRQIVDFYRAEPERVRVVPFPVAPFALRQAKEVPANSGNKPAGGRPYLFYPAQFWPHKNHVALLHALKLLKTKYRIDLDLICCGSDKGDLAHVRDTARSLGLENQVHFLGFVPQEELHALYRDAFALVYPSLFGPDNLPPLEAFAIGCPVIAARVAGATEQFADAALLVDPLRDEDIAQAVVRLHEDGGFRRDLIARGKDRIPGLTAQCYVREVVALFDEFEYYRRCWGRKEAPGFKAP
jgi:glycosyltransferase involved in cell wall biosynthesis